MPVKEGVIKAFLHLQHSQFLQFVRSQSKQKPKHDVSLNIHAPGPLFVYTNDIYLWVRA